MIRNKLLIGISIGALAAGTAAAQTGNTSTTQGGGTTSTTGNTINVFNNFPDNDRNASFASANGSGNTITVVQVGDDNSSTAIQNGNNNRIVHRQDGDRHRASSEQTGNGLTSNIRQGNRENSASVTQSGSIGSGSSAGASGSGHVSNVAQGVEVTDTEFGNSTTAADFGTGESAGTGGVARLGENNRATVNQSGSTGQHTSTIRQRSADGAAAAASDNVANVRQIEFGSSSSVTQESRGNTALVGLSGGGNASNTRNTSIISQTNTLFQGGSTSGSFTNNNNGPTSTNNPMSSNVADVAITGTQNTSTVNQNGVQNRAIVSMLNGGSGNTGAGTASNASGDEINGRRTVQANRIEGNSNFMVQAGRGNNAEISSGGLGGRGNRSAIFQGVTVTAAGFGAAGTGPNSGGTSVVSAAPGGTTAQTGGTSHRALAYQRGVLDNLTITQNDNNGGGTAPTTTASGRQGGAFADVSQISFGSTASVTQTGTNSATVSQARNADGSGGDLVVTIDQTDAGDFQGSSGGSAGDPVFGGSTSPTGTSTPAQNFAEVSQSGTRNTATITQNAINARAIVFQMRNSRANTTRIEQGTSASDGTAFGSTVQTTQTGTNTGAGSVNLVADVTQANRGNTANIRQVGQNLSVRTSQAGVAPAGTSTNNVNAGTETAQGPNFAGAANNLIRVSQVNTNSSATITQNGFNLTATVDQRSAVSGGNNRATVTVQQTGNNNSATARQTETAGSNDCSTASNCPQSGSPGNASFPNSRTAGVVNSAEILIIQSASNPTMTSSTTGSNVANAQQEGRGQYAEIRQTGTGNAAGILQGQGATNAVAIIHQTGNNNTFFINQQAAGQYNFVTQSGNGNATATEITSGPTNGTGSTQPGGTSGTTQAAAFGGTIF